MTSIHLTHARIGGARNQIDGADWSVSGISPKAIDQAVRRGRLLRSQAFYGAVTGVSRWLVSTARSALGRRATKKLGCGECTAMMGA